MKKYLALLAAAAFLFPSCSDEEANPVLQIGDSPSITSPSAGSSVVLADSTTEETFASFAWTAADFGFDAAVTYKVEMDVAGNNFEDAVALGVVNKLQLDGVTKGTINNILNGRELPGGTPLDLELRVAATVSSDVQTLYSAPVTITVTPYTIIVVYPQLQVPGSYQGWDPANNSTIIYSVKSDGKYEGYLYFPADDSKFKYTQGTTWTTNWGDDGTDGTLDPNGADIPAGTAGVYKLNVNLTELTHALTRTDWGLIGDATGSWDVDQDMTFDPVTGLWSITTDLGVGKIKFRANDDWAVNFGDTGGNTTLEYGGDDIAVEEAGNYTVALILNQAKYKYSIQKN